MLNVGKVCIIFIIYIIFTTFLYSSEPVLEQAEFSAGDKMETLVHVPETGWYSIRAESPTGTSLALVDRMAGTIKTSGQAGQTDGRIDSLLEKGEYKIKLFPDRNVINNNISLVINPFKETNGTGDIINLPYINDGDFIRTNLGDLELRSYWIHITEKQPFYLEILSRNLIECNIWRNGQWLESIIPHYSTFEPVEGKPMLYCEYYQTLSPGYYLLQCIGGSTREWPEPAPVLDMETGVEEENPFYIRRGFKDIGDTNTIEMKVSPFGRDTYLVNGNTNFFQLIREDKKETILGLGYFSANRSRYYSLSRAFINKESKDPWCSLSTTKGGKKQLLIIQSTPGDKLQLIYFKRSYSYGFSREDTGRQFWLSSLSSIQGESSIDMTPFLFQSDSNTPRKEEVVRLGPGKPLARKINSLGTSSVFLYIEKGGSYYISESDTAGARAEYKFTILGDTGSTTFAQYKKAGSLFELKKGYYSLSIKPSHKGILHFVLHTGSDSTLVPGMLEAGRAKGANSFLWPSVPVSADYYFSLNRRYDVATGIIARALPIDLTAPLPFYLKSGDQTGFPISVKNSSNLVVHGSGINIRLDGRDVAVEEVISPGSYTLTVTNTAPTGGYISLAVEEIKTLPLRVPPDIKKPEVIYPVLMETSPLFYDFDREETRQFLLRVTEPALYGLETTGRLAMSLNVRSPLVPSLFSASSNGVGRNAIIRKYLKPGDYLVETRTRDRSKGRAGVHLIKTPFSDAGLLLPGSIYRNTVEQDKGLRFRVTAETGGQYSIVSSGLGVTFDYRLEDVDGWPEVVNARGSFSGHLEPGEYYFYSLPKSFKTRRLLQLNLPAAQEEESRVISINSTMNHTWQETAERLPDIFTFRIPALLTTNISVTKGMAGTVIKFPDQIISEINGDKQVSIDLEPGDYRLEIKSIEENNNFDYNIGLYTDQLAMGLKKEIRSFPSIITLTNHGEQNVNIWSFGRTDLKASLWNRDMTEFIASGDDLPGDWNFRIIPGLETGIYKLLVEKIGYGSGTPVVFMDPVEELSADPQIIPFTYEKELQQGLIKVPFTTKKEESLVRFKTDNPVPVFMALYKGNIKLAEARDILFIPLVSSTAYTLHLWHQENIPVLLKLDAAVIPAAKHIFNKKEKLNIQGAIKFTNKENISFTLTGNTKKLLYSPGMESACFAPGYVPQNTSGNDGWLVNSGAPALKVGITPLSLKMDSSISLNLNMGEHSFSLSHYSGEILLLEMESPGNKVGATVIREDLSGKGPYNWNSMGFTRTSTLVGIPEKGDFRGNIKSLENKSPDLNQPASITVKSYKLQDKKPLGFNRSTAVPVKPGYGLTYTLERGNQEIFLLIARGLVAFAWDNGVPMGIVAADTENRSVRLPVKGGMISIVNTGKSEALLRLETKKITTAPEPLLSRTSGFEEVLTGQGILRFRVESGKKQENIYIAGDSFHAILKGDDGRLYSGESVDTLLPYQVYPSKAGILEITHQPGFIKVHRSTTQQVYGDLILPDFNLQAISLEKAGRLESRKQLWAVTINEPGYIQLETDTNGIMALFKNNKLVTTTIRGIAGGMNLFFYLEKGNYRVFTRPPGSQHREGAITLRKIKPVDLSREENDIVRFIAPGERQVFKFKVNAHGKIGIGLIVEADSLAADLFDGAFKLLDSGPLIFRQLEEGWYYLVVKAGDDAVQYRPVIYGVEGSVTDIPLNIIKQYK